MFRHALRLIWNRKRANALIIVELALAFLIVFFVAATGSHLWHLWRLPLGFEWQDTLEVLMRNDAETTEDDVERMRSLLATVRDQPEVEWAHVAIPPFRNWTWSTSVEYQGRKTSINVNRMTDGAPEDFGVELLEGRFFDESDFEEGSIAVIIDERVARELFPDGFVPEADIRDREDDEAMEKDAWKVVGVYRAFRQLGELNRMRPYVITRFPIETAESVGATLQVRVRPGTPSSFEEKLQGLAEAEAPTWTFTVTPLAKLRDDRIRERILPLTVAFWMAAFLLLMVAFGLFGVLWQSVTRRTDELGLRRALGADRSRIYQLIVAETLIVALLACLVGALVAIQFPIASSFSALDWRSSFSGIGIGTLALLGLAGLCSLYPAWLASRRSPAEALHYE